MSSQTNVLARLVEQRKLYENNLHVFTSARQIARPEFHSRLDQQIADTRRELDNNTAQLQAAASRLKGGTA